MFMLCFLYNSNFSALKVHFNINRELALIYGSKEVTPDFRSPNFFTMPPSATSITKTDIIYSYIPRISLTDNHCFLGLLFLEPNTHRLMIIPAQVTNPVPTTTNLTQFPNSILTIKDNASTTIRRHALD